MNKKKHLSPSAINVWKIHGFIELSILSLILLILLIITLKQNWPLWIVITLIIVLSLYSFFKIGIAPYLRLKYFFYDINHNEIDIQDGIFIIKRTLVPIVKIQKVYISQGPILKRFNLVNLTIFTSASEETIPTLPKKLAEQIQYHITQLVRVTVENE